MRCWRPILSRVLVVAVLLASLGTARAALADAAADERHEGIELDLVGTWYVLVHYRDSSSANPDLERWDDRLWVFERKGSRLKWTEYPIVVFGDEEGRFERSSHGQTRVMHAWEPNELQRAQIDRGLEFNTRGARTKTLRRSKKDGRWQSSPAPQALSATSVGYHETWTIHDPTGLPRFVRDDVLGSERAETMSGRTRYDAESVYASGHRIRGSFARDETRRGRFRMMRSGEAASVGTKRTQAERVRDMIRIGEEADLPDDPAPPEPGPETGADAVGEE